MQELRTKQLFVLGAGGHAKVLLNIIRLTKQWSTIHVFDDAYSAEISKVVSQLLVTGNSQALYLHLQKNHDADFFIAIGNNAIRARHFSFLSSTGAQAPTLSHPTSVIAETAQIEKGSVIMANAVVNPEAKVGQNTIINTAVVVEHDCVIGDHIHISPNATICGECSVGDGSWIGAGTVILGGKRVGKNCVIGAGSVVTSDIPDNTLAFGVPAKIIKKTVEVI